MLAFVGTCPTGHNINHKDGNKLNPCLENLEYTTLSQNYRHALDVLKFQPPRGEKHWARRLDDNLVRQIRRRCAAGEMQKDIASELRMARSAISKIVSRTHWKHVL